MKKSIIIAIVSIILLIILLLVFKNTEYNFTNKIFHYGVHNGDSDIYSTSYVLTDDGYYYNFIDERDEGARIKLFFGKYIIEDDKIIVNLSKLVRYDDNDKNNLVVEEVESYAEYSFKITKNKLLKEYPYNYYAVIDGLEYFPIYKYDATKDLYKQLEIMYGKTFTMLIDDNKNINN